MDSIAELYGTKEVAEIVGIPEWRVRNFAEGEAFGMPPALKVGSGRGGRRLYDLEGIKRIAVASDLIDAGFAPEAVGRAISVFRNSPFTSWSRLSKVDRRPERLPVLVCEKGDWAIKGNQEAKGMFEERFGFVGTGNKGGLFVLNYLTRLVWLEQRIEEKLSKQAGRLEGKS
jgi:hypothetical protein